MIDFGNIYDNNELTTGLFPIGIGSLEIDLREEFRKLLYGGNSFKPWGHYVIIKHFDLTKPTKEYDKVLKEPIGNNPYEYTLQKVLTYRVANRTPLAEQLIPSGLINIESYIYFFEYNTVIDINDRIWEFDITRNTGSVIFENNIKPTEMYNVKQIDYKRNINGRVEYQAVIVVKDGR